MRTIEYVTLDTTGTRPVSWLHKSVVTHARTHRQLDICQSIARMCTTGFVGTRSSIHNTRLFHYNRDSMPGCHIAAVYRPALQHHYDGVLKVRRKMPIFCLVSAFFPCALFHLIFLVCSVFDFTEILNSDASRRKKKKKSVKNRTTIKSSRGFAFNVYRLDWRIVYAKVPSMTTRRPAVPRSLVMTKRIASSLPTLSVASPRARLKKNRKTGKRRASLARSLMWPRPWRIPHT